MTRKLTALGERLWDAADLLVDLATLGEYGVREPEALECERRPLSGSVPPSPLRDAAPLRGALAETPPSSRWPHRPRPIRAAASLEPSGDVADLPR